MKKQPNEKMGGYSPNDWVPWAGPWFDRGCIVLALVLLALIVRRGVGLSWPWMLGLFVLAFEINDLVVGLVHWALDKYWRYDSPIIGHLVCTFRGHHPDPQELCTHDYVETNNDMYPIVSVLAIVVLICAKTPGANWFLFWLLLIAANSATIHQWAHRERPPLVVGWLQRARILIAPAIHHRHHDGHMSHYCAISGHVNVVADGLGLWRKLEWLIARTTGAKPFHELPIELQRQVGGA
jgi:ubiquitin-conjugating enzyme E2 variant